jgi:hypothetical protein
MRAIRAALSNQQDRLLMDAGSEAGGIDVPRRIMDAKLDEMIDAGLEKFGHLFGGR